MSSTPLLSLQNIHLSYGDGPLLAGANLTVGRRERLCLVGRNGSGKSTLLKIAASLIEPDQGVRFVQPGATLRYLPQEPDVSGFASTLAYVEDGLTGSNNSYAAQYWLEQAGLSGSEHPTTLSGGEARRAALAKALAAEPDILLMDEPTNHLDLPIIEWLESILNNVPCALVLVNHDRRFLSNLSQLTLWLDGGTTRLLDQGFAGFEAWRDSIYEQEELERHKLDRKIEAEEDWLRYGVTARRKRNVRRLGQLQTLRQDRRDERRRDGPIKADIVAGKTSGNIVVEANTISKSYDGRILVKDFSLRLNRGDRLGFIGANGTGKTTLVSMLTGMLASDSGEVTLGTNLTMVTLDQSRASLDLTATVKDTLTGGGTDTLLVNGQMRHVAGYLKDFLFKPEQMRLPVSKLSGGERGRLILARALAQSSNLLVLDEPTNDLDLETLDILQEILSDYIGTILLVSHDRDFLDRVATSVVMAEGDGRWTQYAGGYSDMLAQRGEGIQARKSIKIEVEKKKPQFQEPQFQRSQFQRPQTTKNRLSFNDVHALKTLPQTIEHLTKNIKALSQRLADPELYNRDPAGFEKISLSIAQAQTALAEAEDRWLELEMRREEAG
jgi:ABC transport system ATP-binding/permease protein